mgnify:FL=1
MKYNEFLQSDFWKTIRKRFYSKKTTIKVCFICGSDKNLNLHHRSYKKLNHNTTNNLICLCKICHYDIHFKNGKRINPPEKLSDYIQLSILRFREAGSYPTHLLKYRNQIPKFAE